MFKRKELEQHLIDSIQKIKRKRNIVNDIKLELAEKYDISAGDIQEWIRKPQDMLGELDIRLLFLFTEQIFMKTGDLNIDPRNYFTPVEEKEARIYDANAMRNLFEFPITFENATMVGNNAWSIPIDIKMADLLMKSQLLHYDPELQREMQVKVDNQGNIRYEPTLIKKNVDEIAEHIINGTLVPTTWVWNAALGSSDVGEELIFDAKRQTITVTKGTKLAVVDGFHRLKGSMKALRYNPDLEFNFVLIITNYTKSQAQQYQAQLAEQTPISKNRQQQLKADRYSDGILQRLMQESDLKDRISQDTVLKKTAKQLVTYNVLADSIDSYINIVSKRDAKKIGDFLIDFFDELIGGLPEEFIFNVDEFRKKSLVNHNNMFIFYILLANKMRTDDISLDYLMDIVKNINFSRDNKMWQEYGIIDDNGNIANTESARKGIVKFFSDLEIEEMV